MSWKGNITKGVELNPVPNSKQLSSDFGEVVSDQFQSGDTGRVLGENITSVPKVSPFEKEKAIRRDLDKTKNFSIDLISVDSTILNYMNQRLDLSVMDNGSLVKVPILYASPERWKSVKKDGFLRDNQGKILLPAILIKRTNVSNNKDLMTLNRNLSYEVITKFDQKNKYDKFSILNSKNPYVSKPVKQIYSVVLPDHVLVTYECMIWTDYVDQNNKLLEKINFATHDYWGLDRFRFRTRIDEYTNTVELGAGEDRNVRTTFNLTVYAYLLPETIDGVKSTTSKLFTARKIVVKDGVLNKEEMDDLKEQEKPNRPYSYLKNFGVEYVTEDKPTVERPYLFDKPKEEIEKNYFRPAPKSTLDYGENGWLAYDESYIYVYKSPLGWLRRPIAEFDYDGSVNKYVSGYDSCGNPIYVTDYRPISTAFRVFQRFLDKFYHQVPYKSTDYGEDGWISFDGDYFYIYSFSEWRRIPISVFKDTF